MYFAELQSHLISPSPQTSYTQRIPQDLYSAYDNVCRFGYEFQDVIAGLILAALLMVFIIPALDYIDDFQLKHDYAPYVMVGVTVAAALMYPSIDEWSTCRGDTMLILGTWRPWVGLISWCDNY